jgi:HK97 family phage major capsid protein
MVPNATDFAAAFTLAAPTMIDIIRLAMVQAELAFYPVDGHVLNPADWGDIELTKDSTGGYIFAQPQGLAGPRLWGRPVVSTPAMTAGDWLTGGFKLQTLYDRMQPEVLIASENSDDFEKNLYTMRCEERLGLAIKRPGALITGTFADAITAATTV